MKRTPMMTRYLVKLAIRLAIFLAVFLCYLFRRDWLTAAMTQPIRMGVTPLHLLWMVFMLMMLGHLFPSDLLSMALRKADARQYIPVPGYDELELLRFVQRQNVRAWRVMLVWLVFNAFWGLLYLGGVIDTVDLLMLVVFYFLCDYICILFYCPFQSVIMGNKCCVNCRIYDWGHFMMFTPLLFIPDFYSWSLFFTACVVLIHWEVVYASHPERFWEGSNQVLQCAHCADRTCRMKKTLARKK